MERLEAAKVRECLDVVRRAKGETSFLDVHVHPFDVIFQTLRYERRPRQPGVYASDDSPFDPPGLAPVLLGRSDPPPASYRPAFYQVVVRKLYRHAGPRVLGEQLALAAIDRALLLPVASPAGGDEWQADALLEMFGHDPRFLPAVSVPNSVPDSEIDGFVSRAVASGGARAVKLHPAITGVDLGTTAGRGRLEAILEACGRSAVPLVVHGGRSYPILDPRAEGYAVIGNLARIRWRDAQVPICIAHAGCFASDLDDVERTILPTLDAMLAANPNLWVDVSALERDVLVAVLRHVGLDRLLFGSDALYQPSWVAMVKLVSALERAGRDVEASLRRLAGLNPSLFLSLEHDRC